MATSHRNDSTAAHRYRDAGRTAPTTDGNDDHGVNDNGYATDNNVDNNNNNDYDIDNNDYDIDIKWLR